MKPNLRNAGDGSGPRYTFVYPNTMVNRYSMWMGTIRVCVHPVPKAALCWDDHAIVLSAHNTTMHDMGADAVK